MKYDAFISYRHLERDMYVAKRVHKSLETTKIPRKIQKEIGRKKIDRVFRDQEELPIGSDLGSNIEAALQEAAFLVVICSPQTKESYWVNKEIDTFIHMHGRENILACLVEGDPSESFPPQLLVDEKGEPVEPLAADVRGSSKKEINSKLKTETLRLAAAILHVDYDDLRQRHRERKLRRIVGIVSVIAALALAFAGYTVYNLNKINQEYQQKLVNESKVLAKTSLDVLEDGDARVAAMIAMEGLPIDGNERPLVADDIYALSQAMGTYRLGLNLSHDTVLTHDVGVDEIAENDEGTRLLAYDYNDCVYLWDLDAGNRIMKLPAEIINDDVNQIDDVGFAGNTAIVCSDWYIRGYDENGELVYEYETQGSNTFSSVDFYGNYISLIFAEYKEDTYEKQYAVQILDATNGEELVKYYSEVEPSMGSGTTFNENATLCATNHFVTDDTLANYVTVGNVKTGEVKDIRVQGGSVIDMFFDKDDSLLVLSMAYKDLMAGENCPMYLEHFDTTTGNLLWKQELEYQTVPIDMSYSQVRSNHFEYMGEEQGIVVFSACKVIYVLDFETGELINSIPTNSALERITLGNNSTLIMAGTQDGEVNYYNALTGNKYEDDTVKVTDSLIDFRIKSGVFASMGYRSPMVTVMRFDPDDSKLAEVELDNSYRGYSSATPSGEYFAVSVVVDSTNNIYGFNVYKTDGCEKVGYFEVEDAMYGRNYFLDDETLVVPTYGDKFVYFDVNSGKTKEVRACPEEESYIDKNFSADRHYAILFDGRKYYIYDVYERKTVANGEMDSYMSDMIVTNDGQTVYACDNDGKGFSLKADKGRPKRILADYNIKQFRISQDDTLVSAACLDGYLRVFDIATEEMLDEVEYFGDKDDYVEFSKDSNLIYMQGADLFFRIYDRTSKELVFITDGQLNDLHYMTFDEENNRLAIFNDYEMYVIDLESFGFLDYAAYGRLYIPQKQVVVSAYGTSLFEFPVRTMDELVAQAKELIGDAELSEAQRLRYQIN